MSFIAELRRRNVIRMAGLYLVGAWLAVQVFATLLPVFEAPAWIMKAIVATIVIGFVPNDRGQNSFLLGELLRLSGDAAGARSSYVAARDDARRVSEQQTDNVSAIADLALCEAALGNREVALSLARKAIALLPASRDALRGPGYEEILARTQLRFGDKDAALAGLEHVLATPYQSPYKFGSVLTPAVLRLDPDFDALRDDPRFKKLAEVSDPPPATQAAAKP